MTDPSKIIRKELAKELEEEGVHAPIARDISKLVFGSDGSSSSGFMPFDSDSSSTCAGTNPTDVKLARMVDIVNFWICCVSQ